MAEKKPLDPVVARLVELVFASPDEVASWLARLGLEIIMWEGAALTVHNPHLNFRAGLLWDSDLVSRAVSLGFALCEAYWPLVCPGLLEAVNERWKGEAGEDLLSTERLSTAAKSDISPGGKACFPTAREKQNDHA
jgi:hypothetical protein